MAIGADSYGTRVLDKKRRKALLGACSMLADQFFDDVSLLMSDEASFEETSMLTVLPRKCLPRYDALFAKKFLTAVLVVQWKLFAPGEHRLACLAEELALNALIESASGLMEESGESADFAALENVAFEDRDFDALFDLAEDGIEDTAIGEQLGMQGMKFDEWFEPFSEGACYCVHPYVGEPRSRRRRKGRP
jgi:hypothetical protein